MRAGKRWRPFLAVATYQALADRSQCFAPGRPAQNRRRRGMLSQSLAHPRRHRGQRRATLRRKNPARGAWRRGRFECRRLADWRRLSAHRRVQSIGGTESRDAAGRLTRPARTLPRPGRGTLLGAQSTTAHVAASARYFPQEDRACIRSRAATRRPLRRQGFARGSFRCAEDLQRSARHRLPDSR